MANDAQVLFTCTKTFKESLGTYAQSKNVSVAIVIREAVARAIGYDLSSEQLEDGRRKYATEEARKEAQNKRQKEKRDNLNKFLQLLEQEQRRENVAIIEASLKKRGVSVDD